MKGEVLHDVEDRFVAGDLVALDGVLGLQTGAGTAAQEFTTRQDHFLQGRDYLIPRQPLSAGKLRGPVPITWPAADAGQDPLADVPAEVKQQIGDAVAVLIGPEPELLVGEQACTPFDLGEVIPELRSCIGRQGVGPVGCGHRAHSTGWRARYDPDPAIILMMLILLDEAFPGALGLFEALGEVRTFPGRSVEAADVSQADALVVRSVTRVDAALLKGSSVRFVGSVTSGTDHLDTDWLTAEEITFASAAGCNAGTVAEYVLAAILLLAQRRGFDAGDKTLGVVGVGRIGSRVADWSRALGMRVLQCDPPLQRQTGRDGLVEFGELAAQSDIVTLHVSLTRSGGDATLDMVDQGWLSSLKTGVILINTSRGQVLCEEPLRAAIETGKVGGTVLDVWRNEPDVNRDLATRVDLATPHIAGYSVEARHRGLRMVRDALAAFIEGRAIPCGGGPPPRHVSAEHSADDSDEQVPAPVDIVHDRTCAPHAPDSAAGRWADACEVVHQACDVAAMDRAFREALDRSGGAGSFDDLRRAFASRREFGFHRVTTRSPNSEVSRFLSHVGFRIVR